MKLTPITIPTQKRAVSSAYYDLVTALLDAYREGKAVHLELSKEERFTYSSIRDHLRRRVNRSEDLPPLKLVMKTTDPLSITLWLEKSEPK